MRGTPQAYYYYGPFNLLSEYAISEQEVRAGTVADEIRNTRLAGNGRLFPHGRRSAVPWFAL